MAKFCSQCGSPLDSDAIFCTNCGARIKTAAPNTSASPNSEAAHRFPAQPQQPADQVPRMQPPYYQAPRQPVYYPAQPEQMPGKKKTGLFVGLTAVLLIVAFCITAFITPGFLLNREEPEEPASHSTRRQREEEETKKQTAKSNEKPAPTEVNTRPAGVPQAAINPSLTGKWGFHRSNPNYDVDMVWTFYADGTGDMYANGMHMPIVSYVATETSFTEYPEDGYLLTVYWGEITETIGDTTHTIQLEPMEYGYLLDGNTLRIVYSRDIANDYIDFTRED